MRALTIWQPFASLLAGGFKVNETRGRLTRVRGQVLIHAAAKPITQVERLMTPEAVHLARQLLGVRSLSELPTGCIVGIGILDDCQQITDDMIRRLASEELLLGDYSPGRYAWIFGTAAPMRPIPAKGGQGWWNFDMAAEGAKGASTQALPPR